MSQRDARLILSLTTILLRMDDFKADEPAAKLYATDVVAALHERIKGSEAFVDEAMGVLANVKHLNRELRLDGTISARELAAMDTADMLSATQKKKREQFLRKRAREQTNRDALSLQCGKCGCVRKDRLNMNEIGLDSEENGSHFDYHFDNYCECSHSSESSGDDEKDVAVVEQKESRTARREESSDAEGPKARVGGDGDSAKKPAVERNS
ncbi:hypothetical protein STCU_01030 [Strigomonas culicis]|uniref:TFIIS central domain-containing protein n=1 Tax=Strigomonas culicis TaxID=28005 RepID=S9V3Q6_9TRYP|nr:hypothetical protein STCU_01030 [Strigomonas culicis]|eukprot:EPY35644.1 hypothetical protein STCU_01030 [Strigomonas culicis]